MRYFDKTWYKYKALSDNVDITSIITPPRFFTELCPLANFSDHPSVDSTVQVYNSETLSDSLTKLGTNIKHDQTMWIEQGP